LRKAVIEGVDDSAAGLHRSRSLSSVEMIDPAAFSKVADDHNAVIVSAGRQSHADLPQRATGGRRLVDRVD
jgi:hypothetical protein